MLSVQKKRTLSALVPDTDTDTSRRGPGSFQAELVALYLPSLFELVCNNSLKDFDAVDDRLASGLANLLLDLVHHRHASRFARDHPTKVAALGPKLLRLIIAVADRFETVSISRTFFSI